jgi:probable F420-dependent oxidoreductase
MEFDLYSFGAPLHEVTAYARHAEALGFSGLWFSESKHNPYLCCAAAALATESITIGTDIAVAFPRSPMVSAQVAWDLAASSGGRFVLGLGSQVKGHIERRFSVPFSHPVPRLREYVQAVRAIWRAFQGEEPLRFDGDFYSFSLLTEFFNPGPIDHPEIPIYVAGVNAGIARMAGEVCDGLHLHPLHSVKYLTDVIAPALAAGSAKSGRSPDSTRLACPVFVIAGNDDGELERQRGAVRRQISFYGSTRSYAPVFEIEGWGDVPHELHRLMAAGDLDGMEKLITDDMLDRYAVTSTWDELPAVIAGRYGGLVDRVFPYLRQLDWMDSPELRERWRSVAQAVQRPSVAEISR